MACIRAPEITTVDRATALEQQAGASFPETEQKLARASAVPQAVRLTPDQLDTLGAQASPVVDEHDQTDAELVDDLLERHCVGEGNDGLLAETKDACHGGVADHDELVKLVDRANRARAQVWRWMQEQQPNVSEVEVRKRWRAKHAEGVTCGAWMQDDAGKWSAKTC
jgi:uncharacterized protein YdbL (DUF1318 family)